MGCIPLAVAAGGVWLEMIARSNTTRTCHTLLTRGQDTRPLSNSQYIFIGLIDFSRAPRVVFVKVGRATCAAKPISFYFRFRCTRYPFHMARAGATDAASRSSLVFKARKFRLLDAAANIERAPRKREIPVPRDRCYEDRKSVV